MVSEANEPGSESGKRSDDRRGAARGTRAGSWTPQEGGASSHLAARLPPRSPGSFAAVAMIPRQPPRAPSGRLGLRRRRPAPQRAEGDAARDDVERVVEGAPQAEVLGHDDPQVDDAERGSDPGDLGEVEDEPAHHQIG